MATGDDELLRRCEREVAVAARKALEEGVPSAQASGADELASAMDGLLRVRVRELGESQRFGSPDGIFVRRLEARSSRSLRLLGWVIEVATQRCEPFEAELELTEDGSEVRTYRLSIGDAIKGLQRLPTESRQVRLNEPAVEDWLIVICRESERR